MAPAGPGTHPTPGLRPVRGRLTNVHKEREERPPAAGSSSARRLARMPGYETLAGLEHLYLEDSWGLGVYQSATALTFDLEAVITEEHPYWRPPKPGEQYTYRRIALLFPGVRSIQWLSRGGPPATDASGEQDWGDIHSFIVDDGVYELEGDWGHVPVASDPPEVLDR